MSIVSMYKFFSRQLAVVVTIIVLLADFSTQSHAQAIRETIDTLFHDNPSLNILVEFSARFGKQNDRNLLFKFENDAIIVYRLKNNSCLGQKCPTIIYSKCDSTLTPYAFYEENSFVMLDDISDSKLGSINIVFDDGLVLSLSCAGVVFSSSNR